MRSSIARIKQVILFAKLDWAEILPSEAVILAVALICYVLLNGSSYKAHM